MSECFCGVHGKDCSKSLESSLAQAKAELEKYKNARPGYYKDSDVARLESRAEKAEAELQAIRDIQPEAYNNESALDRMKRMKGNLLSYQKANSDLNNKFIASELMCERMAVAIRRCVLWMGPVMDGFKVQPNAESRKEVLDFSKEALAAYEQSRDTEPQK